MFLITRMVAGLHGALSDEGSPPTVAVPFPAYTGVPQAPAPVPSPTVPIPAKPPAVLTSVADLLGTQIAGVRAGNESWFLGTIDPQARAAVATYKRLFANLHTLRASDFTESSGAVGDSIRAKTWIRVNVAFCIDGTTTGCTLASADLDVQVGPRGKGVAIEAVNPVADLGRVAVPPWLATSLTASLAGNVLLVGTPATKARIVDMVKAAEVAGALADQYAPIGVPPRPYVVYLATHADVAAWFGGPGQISHGVVDPSIGDDQAVLALPEATTKGPKGGDGLAADMQRALGKLSLTHGDDTPFLVDTLSLGIQEHAAYDGLPGADADTLAPLAGFVHSGAWDGSCYYTYDSQAGLDAMPGIGLLAIRYLVKYYGIDAVMNFWTKVERQRESVQNASIEEFNMAWSDVNGDCAAYVLDTADNP